MISGFYARDPTPVPRRIPYSDFTRPSLATIDFFNSQCYTITVPVVSLDVRRSLWRDSGNTYGTFATISEGGAANGSRYCNNNFFCNISSFEVAYYSSSIRMAHPPKILTSRLFVAFFIPSVTALRMNPCMTGLAQRYKVARIMSAALCQRQLMVYFLH